MASADLINTIASISFIMDHHEKLGTIKNPILVAEFIRLHAELLTTLEKENEARTRANQHGRSDQDRTSQSSGGPRSGITAGEYGGPRHEV